MSEYEKHIIELFKILTPYGKDQPRRAIFQEKLNQLEIYLDTRKATTRLISDDHINFIEEQNNEEIE